MSTYATQPNLDAMKPIGNGIDAPQYKDGESTIIATKSADMTNSDSTLNIGYDQTNRAAQYKYPRTSQDTGTMYSDQK